jgi:hypothetical protein
MSLVHAKEIAQALLAEAILKFQVTLGAVTKAPKETEQVADVVQCASVPEPISSDPGSTDKGRNSQTKQRKQEISARP